MFTPVKSRIGNEKSFDYSITGQDGSYLAELLLGKGYEVHGIKRRASLFNTQRIDHIYEDPHVGNSRLKRIMVIYRIHQT